MTREGKGLIAGLAAGAIALGGTLGVAVLVRATSGSHVAPSNRAAQATAQATRVAAGQRLFLANCATCHGREAQGMVGPNLHALALSDAQIENTIKNGKPGGMPAFKGRLTRNDVRALVAYLRSLR